MTEYAPEFFFNAHLPARVKCQRPHKSPEKWPYGQNSWSPLRQNAVFTPNSPTGVHETGLRGTLKWSPAPLLTNCARNIPLFKALPRKSPAYIYCLLYPPSPIRNKLIMSSAESTACLAISLLYWFISVKETAYPLFIAAWYSATYCPIIGQTTICCRYRTHLLFSDLSFQSDKIGQLFDFILCGRAISGLFRQAQLNHQK